MNIIIERTIELNAPLLTEPLPGSLFTTEDKAHQFLIACTQNGLPVTLSGTVSAKFIREANNTTILMSGSISGGKASLILPADCYNISGRFDLTIFVTANNVTTCIYSATGSVKAAQDGTLVDEGTVVPSIEQLQQDVTNLQNTKVNRSGDTMTGPLNLRSATVFSTGDGYARLYFKDTVSGANLAAFNLLVSNRRLFATEYSAGSPNVERYYFPAPDENRTADGNYDVLTSKSPVTVAQGGTGVTGPIGITLTPGSNITLVRASSKTWGKLVVLNFVITSSASISSGGVLLTTQNMPAPNANTDVAMFTSAGGIGLGIINGGATSIVANATIAAGTYFCNATFMVN